jgi:hypothetical protein
MPIASPLSKRILVVERVGGELHGLDEFCVAHGIEVLRAPDTRTVATLGKDLRRMAAVVINVESVRGDVAPLVQSIKAQHPDMPIFWFADPDGLAKPPRKVEVVGTDLKKLEAGLSTVLREVVYSSLFMNRFTSLCLSALQEYRLPDTPGTPYIKASLSSLSEVNAYITFTGRHVSGHALMCATSSDVRQAYMLHFPRERSPGLDDLEDHLGEAVNRLVGKVKRLVDRDEDCTVGVPYFLRGEGVCLRHKTGAPALAIEVSNGSERLLIELCFYRFDDWALSSLKSYVAQDNDSEAGELKLL